MSSIPATAFPAIAYRAEWGTRRTWCPSTPPGACELGAAPSSTTSSDSIPDDIRAWLAKDTERTSLILGMCGAGGCRRVGVVAGEHVGDTAISAALALGAVNPP